MIRFSYDDVTGILHCTVRGTLSVDEARRYVFNLKRETDAARIRAGRLKLLIDYTDDIIQAPEVTEKAAEGGSMIVGPDDRMAVVVGSMLAKGRTRRLLTNAQEQAFRSASAATTWLLALDQTRVA